MKSNSVNVDVWWNFIFCKWLKHFLLFLIDHEIAFVFLKLPLSFLMPPQPIIYHLLIWPAPFETPVVWEPLVVTSRVVDPSLGSLPPWWSHPRTVISWLPAAKSWDYRRMNWALHVCQEDSDVFLFPKMVVPVPQKHTPQNGHFLETPRCVLFFPEDSVRFWMFSEERRLNWKYEHVHFG